MPRPSKRMIELYEAQPILGGQLENIISDFCYAMGPDNEYPPELDQKFIDTMFSCFMAGMSTVIDPKSNFNSKYMYKTLPSHE